jgi:putative ABC transport system permease protein
LFSGRPAVGETVEVGGVRFTVIGVMARKIQLSNYFSSDDDSAWIPLLDRRRLWNTRYAAVMLFEPIAPQFEKKLWRRCWPRWPRGRIFPPPIRKHSDVRAR